MWKYLFLAVCCVQAGEVAGTAVPEHAILPSSTYRNTPYFQLDALYWSAKQEGNDYASTGKAITLPGTTDPNTGPTPGGIVPGKVYAPDTVAKPGFKIAMGFDLKHDTWEAVIKYSWLHSSTSNGVKSSDLNAGIIPTFVYAPHNSLLSKTTFLDATGATGYVSEASSSWKFRYNNLNIELSKLVPLFCNTAIRPHFGIEASWQSQTFDVLYAINSIQVLNAPLGSNSVSFHQVFWGVGPRIGIDSMWKGHRHGGFFATLGAAALWGPFNTITKAIDTNTLIADQKYNPTSLSPVIDITIGSFSDWIFFEVYHVLIQLGWEASVWFNQNQHALSNVPDINLVLQGLTVSARLDF